MRCLVVKPTAVRQRHFVMEGVNTCEEMSYYYLMTFNASGSSNVAVSGVVANAGGRQLPPPVVTLKAQQRSRRHNTGRVDGLMAVIVVALDVI